VPASLPRPAAQRLLDALREQGLIVDRLSDRHVALHGGSSVDLAGSPATLPPGGDEPEGPPSPHSSTNRRDNLSERAAGRCIGATSSSCERRRSKPR
jgi:hypothetical protein